MVGGSCAKAPEERPKTTERNSFRVIEIVSLFDPWPKMIITTTRKGSVSRWFSFSFLI